MRRKVLVIVTLIMSLVLLVGCSQSKPGSKNSTTSNKQTAKSDTNTSKDSSTNSSTKGKMEVQMDINYTLSGGTLALSCKTNLPDNMPLYVKIVESSTGFVIKDDITSQKVSKGAFSASYKGFVNGTYKISITSPAISILDTSIKSVLGNSGENTSGAYVLNPNSDTAKISFEKVITLG